MSKRKKNERREAGARRAPERRPWLAPVAGLIALACVAALIAAYANRDRPAPAATVPASGSLPSNAPPAAPPAAPAGSVPEPTETMEVAKAVVVAAELDFGGRVPSVAEALTQIERRSKPDDGRGRTFAVLDADGWPTPDGKLHLQMHVSSEKPGIGSLVFRRTGEVLWNSRILGSAAPLQKNLTILIDDGSGRMLTVDGTKAPPSVIEATVKETGAPVKQVWPDGTDRELTFVYSACGCPVKVMARRQGDRAVRAASTRLDGSLRASDLPVIFPDDPAAVATIAGLMRW